MLEKIIFNLFAFTLFILIFIKFIRKNDTSYVYLLITQFVGIAINFIELSFGKSFGSNCKINNVFIICNITNLFHMARI